MNKNTLFSQRYSELIQGDKNDFLGEIDYEVKGKIVRIMVTFSEPITFKVSRYNEEYVNTDAFYHAIHLYNDLMGYDVIDIYNQGAYEGFYVGAQLQGSDEILFDVIELQYEVLSAKEKKAFASEINKTFSQNDLPWLLVDGKILKIDAKQFEVDLKQKTMEKIKELTDCDPKFKSAYNELQKAMEFFSKGDYPEAIINAEKCYESVMKITLGVSKGTANDLTNKMLGQLSLPNAISSEGFQNNVLMTLPYIRNKVASHGAGAADISISKSLANLAINLAASLCTYLIEESKESIK